MGADQIAELRPPIVEVLAVPQETWCATFELTGDAGRWIQITVDALNMAYPFEQPPAVLLAERAPAALESLELVEWKAGQSATFRFPSDTTAKSLAVLADDLFRGVLGCAADYSLDVSLTEL